MFEASMTVDYTDSDPIKCVMGSFHNILPFISLRGGKTEPAAVVDALFTSSREMVWRNEGRRKCPVLWRHFRV